MGFPVTAGDILTAPVIAAAYLQDCYPGARYMLLNSGDIGQDLADGADLAEQLPAILRGGLDRQVALIEPGHQILEQIPTRSPAARR